MRIRSTNDLVKFLKSRMKSDGLTAEKVAFYSGLSKSTLSGILNGTAKEYTFKTVLKIMKAVDVALEINEVSERS